MKTCPFCSRRTLKTLCLSAAVLIGMAAGVPLRAETTLAEPWVDRSFAGIHEPFGHMLIIGIANDPQDRRKLEQAMVGVLEGQGVEAEASLDLMSPDAEINKETVLAAIEGRGIDSILVTVLYRVEDVDIVKIDDPGSKRSERDFALGLWRDFRDTYDYALDAPVDKRLRVILENNVYDAATAELVWTVQSHSMDPKSVDEIVKPLSRLVTESLKKENLI